MSFADWRARGRNKGKANRRSAKRRRLGYRTGLHCEALEQRQVLSVSMAPIVGPDLGGVFAVPSGKDLYVPLTSVDVGNTVTYTASSSNPNVTVEILSGNPTLKLDVTGTNSSGQAFSGTLTIQLFEDLAPFTVAQIQSLVDTGFYDGLRFYRIVPDFVIQGGAQGLQSAPTFDDEFNVDLTFNSPGMLAMANPGSINSNTSEFFITDIDEPLIDTPQYLNFRHSIFGQLTSGFDVYLNIMNAQGITPTNSSPTSPVTITSATIITDTQNGVVRVSEPNGFTGTSVITVTANSSDGSSDTQNFTIDAAPATQTSANQPLILNTVNDQTTTAGNAVSFQVSANQIFASTLAFSVTSPNNFRDTPGNVSVTVTQIDDTTATVTLTPAAGFAGTLELLVHVDDDPNSLHDAQAFTLTVVGTLGTSSVTDPINIGNVNNVTVSGNSGIGNTISLVATDGTITTAPHTTTVDSNGQWTITGIDVSALADGTITFTASDTTVGGMATITALKDTVAPGLTITDVTAPIGLANRNAVVVSGTGVVGLTVTLSVTDGATSLPSLSTTVGADGTWTISGIDVTSLNDGIISLTAVSMDAAGNAAQFSTTTALDTVPPAVGITTVTDPITLGNATNASASGTGEVGATISLVVTDGTNTTIAYTTTVAGDGTWSITGIDVSNLTDGTITYRATASDNAGNTAEATQTATKSAVGITTITSPINAANADNTSVSGTAAAGAQISLVVTDGVDTTIAYTTTADEDGNWSIFGIDVSDLADGPITYVVTATIDEETAEHSQTVTKDTVPPDVSALSATDPINAANAAVTFVNGTSEAGVTISVVASDGTNSTTAQSTTVSDLGTWSVSGIDVSALDDGTITYTITATDAAGNTTVITKTSTKDTVAPTVEITSATTPITIANSDSISVSGTGEVGATVSVVADDGTNTTAAVTVTVGEDGTWSVTGIDVSALADGTITYTATISDAAFNTATDTLTATKATVHITVVTDPVNISNVASVTVSGTGEVGATVSVVASDGTNSTVAVTTTVGANGTWSISGINLSALADGTITFTATATDDEENTAQSTITTTKDTVAPSLAITSVTDPITTDNAAGVVVNGTGEVGALVIVTVTDGTNTTTSHSVTVAANGTWSISNIDVTALADGTLTVNATTTDGAGNTSQTSLTAVKTAAADGTLSGTVYRDSNGNGAFGPGEIGVAGVIITLHGTDPQGNPILSRTTITAADGSYSFTNLPAGTYSLTMSQPAKFNPGSATAGALGGSAGINVITGISVAGDDAGTGYNFGVGSLDPSMISARLFLASTPPADQLFAEIVSQNGIAAPVVTSIVKADADPTTSNELRFTVTFNESVTGVDASDFAVIGSSSASIASVTGSGATYVVTVNTGGATGNIGLRLVDNDSIVSAAATPLGGAGASNGDFVGPSYSVSVGETTVAINAVTDPINAANADSVTASGTGEVGATISLVVTDGTNSTTAFTTTVAADGTWTISGIDVSGLNDGTLTFNVTATDTEDNTATASTTATKDTVAPQVEVSTVTDPVNASNAASTTASGTGEAGATISVVVTDGTNSTTAMTTTVAGDGTWTITGINVSALADGTITYNVTATDAAGNSATSSKTASKDTVAPAVALTSVTDPITIANHSQTEASGTGEVGATISLVASDGTNTTIAYTTVVAADGTWTITGIDVSALADGTITYTATASDAAGNTATSSLTSTKTTIAITSVTDPINGENQTNVSISGTGEVGATVSVVASDGTNSTIAYTTTIGEDGTWSISEIDVSDLADGTITFTATATDAEDNTAETSVTAMKDTVAPEVAITAVTNPINSINASDVSASGTGDVGDSISLVVSDGTNSTIAYTTTVGEDGTWSITGIDVSELEDGTLTFTVTATDAANNTSSDSLTSTKDTVAPAVTISGLTEGVTIANHQSLTLSGNGEVDASISLVVSDGTNSTEAYTTTVDSNGDWTITGIDTSGLNDGELTFTVTATDAAGNPGEASITAQKTTVAAASVTDPINADGATDVTISGTGQPLATVTVVATDGTNSTIAYTTTIAEDGTWSIGGIDVSELADGTITFHVTAADENENTAETSITAEKDTLAPEVELTFVTDPINAALATSVSASGTGEVGATISLVATDGTNSTIAYTTTVGEDGTWTIDDIDVSGLNDGEITFTATATDEIGNSATSSLSAALDVTPPAVDITSVPAAITIASAGSVEIGGTGEVGASISLVAGDGVDSTIEYTTTVDEEGNWSIEGIDVSALADGTITFTVTAKDAAGNETETSETSVKTTVAITSITEPINAENAGDVTVSGTGEIGATISLVVSDGTNSTSEYTTTIDEIGNWSITGVDVSTLDDGSITFTATATDGDSNTAEFSETVEKDTVAPEVELTSVTDPINANNADSFSASGTGEVGATISLVASDGTNATDARTTTVSEFGIWSIEGIDVTALDDGTITFTVTATDAAGNTSTDSAEATKDVVAPELDITSILDPITIANHHATAIGGTGEVGATISVVASDGTNSTTAHMTIVDEAGNWSFEDIDTGALNDGVLTYTVTATDAAGNSTTDTLTATKHTVAITSVTDPINAENAEDVTVSGTGEVGATVSLVVSDGTSSTIEYTTTIDQDGNWTITGIDVSSLEDGTLTFTATATDEDENTAQTSITAEKDTVAPELAMTSVTDPIDNDNVTSASASGTGEVGATISLVVTDGTNTTDAFLAAVSEDGTWSIIDIDVSGLDDGTITYTATATDSFGNTSEDSQTATKETDVDSLVDLVMGDEDDWT